MTKKTFTVEETEHLWIEMVDGTRLAARLWRPVTDQPVPAILEYIPYRKADMVRARDERNHPFFATHGYACIRVDMRGSGDSEGHMPDMYAPAELDDARQVINWLADQPWCNGRVGMFGTSWGGTAALQASVDAPGPLKAVIAVCATHDRYEDDIHHMGGCVLTDTFEWGATLPAILASPPTPHVGENWKEQWRERIETLACPLENWLPERGRGDYWRHGSVIHQADRFSVPILAVGGWSDRYSNSVMSLVDARPDLVWGVVGPWGHHYPDHASPGPGIGFQHLALDWWDHHLKNAPTHPLNWPRLRSWLREFDEPRNKIEQRNGWWIETEPPSQMTQSVSLKLSDIASDAGPWQVPQGPTVGTASGDTGYFGRSGGLPLDQSPDDALSLVFETAAMQEDVTIYGAPVLSLQGATRDGSGKLAIRLSDVARNGVACRISYGIRNLALDDALDTICDPDPEGAFDASIPLHSTAYLLRRGHRLRIAVSASLWPLIWPSVSGNDIAIVAGVLQLPVLPTGDYTMKTPIPEVEDLPLRKSHEVIASPELKRWVNTSDGYSELGWHQPEVTIAYHQTDTAFSYETRVTHEQQRSEELSHRVSVNHRMVFARPDGRAEVEARLDTQSIGGTPHVCLSLKATWNDIEIGERAWDIPAAAKS